MCYFYSWFNIEFKLTCVREVILWLKKAMSYYPYSVVVFVLFFFFFLFTLKNLFLVLFFGKKHNPLKRDHNDTRNKERLFNERFSNLVVK